MPDHVRMAGEPGQAGLEGALPGLAGFDRYFAEELKPVLDGLEAERPRALRSFYIFAAGAALLCAVGAYFILLRRLAGPESMILVGMAGLGLGYWGYRPLAALRQKTKVAVMHHLCEYLGLVYRPRPANVSLRRHRDLSLIPSYDESRLEDQIDGKIGAVDFNLFEAKLIAISRDSKGRTRRTTVFRGLLAEFDFHKQFTGTTIITRDYTAFGNFFGGLGKSGERVRLEDPVFESLFEVYATDQVEARYLLTPGFMERIRHLSARVGRGNLQLAFDRGNLLLAIKKNKNSFEGGSAFSSFADVRHIRHTIEELALIYDIVHRLKLDMATRI